MHQNADALSRLPTLTSDDSKHEELEQMDIYLADEVSSFPIDALQIAECTIKDKILSKVHNFIIKGWPNKVEVDFQPYYNRRESLTTVNGVILLQTDANRESVFARRF